MVGITLRFGDGRGRFWLCAHDPLAALLGYGLSQLGEWALAGSVWLLMSALGH
jgi:hypothetical protein